MILPTNDPRPHLVWRKAVGDPVHHLWRLTSTGYHLSLCEQEGHLKGVPHEATWPLRKADSRCPPCEAALRRVVQTGNTVVLCVPPTPPLADAVPIEVSIHLLDSPKDKP